MTFRYIGSKARLTQPLSAAIRPFLQGGGRFVDAFAGTGSVASAAADEGWPVWVNDALNSATIMSHARLLSSSEAEFKLLGGYEAAVEHLNGLAPTEGYFHATYSPASSRFDAGGIARMYLSESNASRLDAIRDRISHWRLAERIDHNEETLLLGDLIGAVNRVANIAGTYGCFMSRWQPNALRDLAMSPRSLRAQPVDWKATTGSAEVLKVGRDDLVYLDPPYTKRQYASYYHILESIVLDDKPEVQGVSGLRPWQAKASAFCYKRKALQALIDTVTGYTCGQVILSYSSEGHVDLDDLLTALNLTGDVACIDIDGIGRYRPNRMASSRGDTVTEYVITYKTHRATTREIRQNTPQTLQELRA
jgi:adenine-specific DNA-methyltransferase